MRYFFVWAFTALNTNLNNITNLNVIAQEKSVQATANQTVQLTGLSFSVSRGTVRAVVPMFVHGSSNSGAVSNVRYYGAPGGSKPDIAMASSSVTQTVTFVFAVYYTK